MANTSGRFEPVDEKARFEAEDCGRLVELVRNEEGLTRAQLASAAGVSEEDVDRFEAGRISPVEPMLTTLLRAMDRTA